MEINVQNLLPESYLEIRDQGCEIVNLDHGKDTVEEKNCLKESLHAWKRDVEVQTSPFLAQDKEDEHIKSLVHRPLPIFRYSPDVEVSQSPCFQFDRLAPARVSLSPSLRRMRRKMMARPASPRSAGRAQRPLEDPEELASNGDSSVPANYLQIPRPTTEAASVDQRAIGKEVPTQLQQDSPQSVAVLLPENQQKGDHIGDVPNIPHTEKDIPLWARRRGDCTFTLLDNLQETGSQRPFTDLISGTQVESPLHMTHSNSTLRIPYDPSGNVPATTSRCTSHRRRSSLVVCLPGLEIFPGDLLISHHVEHLYRTASTPSLSTESKKLKWPFAKRGTSKVKQKQVSHLESLLASLVIRDCTDQLFQQYKDKSWTCVTKIRELKPDTKPEQKDKKLQEAMWEIFTSECNYFSDKLLVMEEVFLNTLRHVQSEGWLVDIDPWRLFANLSELSKVSFDFLTSLLDAIESCWTLSSLLAVLSKFQEGVCCSHQKYCLNYASANLYLNNLKMREDFGIFLKWCEQNEQCKRLHLSDLLVSPLQRLTRYPLLLRNLWKRSTETEEKQRIQAIIRQVDSSICDLEGKVKWLDKIQKFQQIHEMIVWPPIWERNKAIFLPESLRYLVKDNMADGLLSPVNRQLLHEGRLSLAGATKLLDVHLFLFDDLLLITQVKSAKKKPGAIDTGVRSPMPNPDVLGMGRDGTACSVVDQPIPLDRLVLKNIDPLNSAGCGLHNVFLVIHQNRYQQCIGTFTLQAPSEAVKRTWLLHIEKAATGYRNVLDPPQLSLRRLPVNESSEI
ncbi:pleckstrin homology domain-containing family G member 7 isoform X2 [Stegostoma tigrinum]|uniref:pleckstrin homology domain-containing family G member 7 isoform X2 n=1 Tax=Stegostoma tigrinum TaxID=3053191 RepID=UPI00202B2FDD|nr:pleckstrin homology domain-containing family G member 7 isoform X2 [Stegostoma tigrinum]